MFGWMFFIPYHKWKTLLFKRSYCYSEAFNSRCVFVFFETSTLKEVLIFSPLAPQWHDNANSKGPKESCCSLYLSNFCECTFFFINEIFKENQKTQNLSKSMLFIMSSELLLNYLWCDIYIYIYIYNIYIYTYIYFI